VKGAFAHSCPKIGVPQDRQMRKHRIALEHDAAIRVRIRREERAVEQDRATRVGFLAQRNPQEAALAGAGRADDRDEGARRCRDSPLEHDLVAIFDPDIFEG
jgi:hypothetical protein